MEGRKGGREVEGAERGRWNVRCRSAQCRRSRDRSIRRSSVHVSFGRLCRRIGRYVRPLANCRSVDTIGRAVHNPSVKVTLARYCRSVGALSGGTRADRSLLSDGRSVNQSVRWYVGRRVCHLSANARLAGCRLSVGFYPSMRMPFS